MDRVHHKINWEEIEHRYVTGTESYKTLSGIYKLSLKLICKHGKANDWTKKRKEFRASVLRQANDQAEESAIENLKKLGVVAGKAVKNLDSYFSIADSLIYKTDEFRQLTGALKDLTSVLRDIYDITENQTDNNDAVIHVIFPDDKDVSMYDS